MTTENVLKIKAVVLGHAIGDALGVPVEFCSRAELGENPVTDMRGFGSFPVPAGAWSDDTSMSLAGALYGYESIPHEWLNTLIKRDYIEKMCEKWQ